MVSESEQKYHMEAPLSQLGQCWLPATALVFLKTLQCCLLPLETSLWPSPCTGLLSALHFLRVGSLTGHCWQQGALGEGAAERILLQPNDTDQVRGKPAAIKYPLALPFPQQRPSVCKGGAPPGSACNQGRQEVAN